MDSFDSVGHDIAASQTHDGAEELAPLTLRTQLSLSALWLGVNAISAALLPIVLPIQLLLYVGSGQVGDAQQAELLGWLSALGAIIALVVPPLIGALSDRTTFALGRRRPYILLGVAISVVGAWGLAHASDLNSLTITFLLLQLGFNVTVGAYQGLLPDRTPEQQRGAASGYLGLMTILGNVGSLALAGAIFASVSLSNALSNAGRMVITNGSIIFYGGTTAALILTMIITVIWTSETRLTTAEAATQRRPATTQSANRLARGLQSLRALWLEPWKSHNFTWVFLTRAFVMLGLTLFLTFIEYYFANVEHVSSFVSATAVVAGLALVGAVLSALTLGILSDRMNRALLVGISTGLMALPALVFVIAPGRIPLWPLGVVFGLGYGAYTSVDWALAVDALPRRTDAGKDLGIWSVASTLPAIVAPALGGAVIALTQGVYHQTALGYRAIFALAAAFLALGAVCVSFIRGEQTPPQPTAALASVPALTPTAPTPPTTSTTPTTITPSARPGAGWRLAGASHGGRARGFLRFWPVWERIYGAFLPTVAIPGAPHGVLHVHFGRYRGRPITLPDGTRIARGAHIVALHFDNQRIMDAARTAGAFELVSMVADDMGALGAWAARPDQPKGLARAQAVYGLTLIGRAAPRLGFIIRERPITLIARADRFFMMGLMALYNNDGVRRLARGTTFGGYPVEVWMSRGKLLQRYGAQSASLAQPDQAG